MTSHEVSVSDRERMSEQIYSINSVLSRNTLASYIRLIKLKWSIHDAFQDQLEPAQDAIVRGITSVIGGIFQEVTHDGSGGQ